MAIKYEVGQVWKAQPVSSYEGEFKGHYWKLKIIYKTYNYHCEIRWICLKMAKTKRDIDAYDLWVFSDRGWLVDDIGFDVILSERMKAAKRDLV